ncbi:MULTISPECIES: DUF2975 domain-containing protein [unclassified Sphingopyxis]|uniref:DUF2975 domain-containing protein n=1 Tax=unclassified Sphingopyxis TaxID=2614943 RepID=UPI0006BF6D11|nr:MULTISPECIES: DUF2975 domain-containing protein [unclassified Sphingopyxis]USI78338.1 DUF2975 domain-containing protein [Sphingopyxis sp. USTB-05]GAO79268.1 hypothetical protein SC1_02588 [Sphingopyxis sp. C-1]
MPTNHSTLLGVTRGLLWLMLALVAVALLVIVASSGALVVMWPDIAAEAKNNSVFIDVDTMRPQLFALFGILAAILAAAVYILRQLQALVTSAAGDPFIPTNALRLRRIGWALVATQLLAFPLGWVASNIAVSTSTFANMGGLDLQGLLAILLAFVLAAVFERGAAMRDELEGTV